MKIKSQAQLEAMSRDGGMNERIAQQIRDRLAEVQTDTPKARKAGRAGKSRRAANTSPIDNVCFLPPVMPADRLYHELVRRYGRFHNGGHVCWELEMLPDSRHRLDIAFPYFKLGLEMDGYESHGLHLDGFKRDRIKSVAVVKAGWSLMHVSHDQVENHMDSILADVDTAIANRTPSTPLPIKVLPCGWSRMIYD